MIFVLIFFGIILIAFTLLTLFSLGLSLLVGASTIIAISIKQSRKSGFVILALSLVGTFLGCLVPLLFTLFLQESVSTVPIWAYLCWGMIGYAFSGAAACILTAGISLLILPWVFLKNRSNPSAQSATEKLSAPLRH